MGAARLTILALFLVGVVLNVYAYESFEPVVVGGIFFGGIYGVLLVPRIGGAAELRMFSFVFSVNFVMAGVAAIYANIFRDEIQLFSDAGNFFNLAVGGGTDGLSLDDIKRSHEAALAIRVWAVVYDVFAAFGFARERYVGVTVNVAAVALSGVFGIKMARQIYGEDLYRFRILNLLVGGCGLLWLFAAIHLRDAVVLFAVTLLAYSWLHYLAKPDFGWRFGQMVGLSAFAGLFFGFLRAEFLFVPVAMCMAGVSALALSAKEGRRSALIYVSILLGLAVTTALLSTFGGAMQFVVSSGGKDYSEFAAATNASDSLGMALIVNQALPVRLVLGSLYLFVYPVPFWIGFQTNSAYPLFKSFNVLYFYFVMPLLALAVWGLWKYQSQRTPSLLFLLFLSLGFVGAIAGTSLETRHLGAFFIPMFVLALLPDIRNRVVWRSYERLLMLLLSAATLGHLAWAILKMKLI